ncbi:MAG: PKD domain-containing protein [Methanomassiliicoccales archaeon]|jgi:PKD repeat protein|nr:PKD domain-containing protein [Methanomassiliicoccales archaeon]
MNKFCGAVLLSVLLMITVPLVSERPEIGQHQSIISQAQHFLLEGENGPAGNFDLFTTVLRTKNDPAFIRVGDFNNDSRKDIAVGSGVNKTIELFFQRTDGTFAIEPSRTINLGSTITGMAIGDLDGDGTDDIIVTSATIRRAYLLYQRFDYSISYKDARPDPYGVVINDFDGDGFNDFAYVSYNSSISPNCTFTVHLKKTGFFPENYVRLDIPAGLFRATLIETADLDQDGHPDLAIGDTDFSRIAIYKGGIVSGIPTWTQIQIIDSSSLRNPIEMHFIQVDMLGPEELVVLSERDNKITIFKYDSAIRQLIEYITKENLDDPITTTMLDANDDSIHDLISVSRDSCLVEIFLTKLALPYGEPNFTFPSNAFPLKAISADINNDSLDDLIISADATSLNGSITIYYRLKSGFLSNANENIFLDGGSLPTSIVQGDFDKDGIVEIGAICTNNTLKFHKISQHETGSKVTGISPFEAKTADLTNDTVPDIVVSNSGSNNITFYFGGDAFFQNQAVSLSLQINESLDSPRGISINDINGDGRPDVVIACDFGIQIFFNIGAPSYFDEFHSSTILAPGSSYTHLTTGNFNAGYETTMRWPAMIDIAAFNSSARKLEIYFQHYPSHSFSILQRAEFVPDASSVAVSLNSGKINSDSLVDLVVPLNNGLLVVYIQKTGLPNGFSDGSGSKFSTFLQNGIWTGSIGDLDDDGFDEIAVMSNRIGLISSIEFDGSAFKHIQSFSCGGGFGNLLVADVNGDLRHDLLISSPLSAAISINYQNNLPPRALALCASSPPLQEGTGVFFDGRNSSDSYSDRASLNYTWFFGDGHIYYGDTAFHIFMADGNYNVSLRVIDRGGLSNYSNITVIIEDLSPTASFNINPSEVNEGSAVEFVDTSRSYPDPIISRRWEFGDGTIVDGNSSSVTHTYMKDGTYRVNLTVTDSDESVSSTSIEIRVRDNIPSVSFIVSPASPIENSKVSFIDNSFSYPDTIVAWNWEFGDGGTSNEKNPEHIYSQNGTFTVVLRVWDEDGSTNSSSLVVQVRDSVPTVLFSFNPLDPKEGQPVMFEDNSTAYDGIVSWSWDFGDGTHSSERNPSHYYADNGTFNVRLTVVDGDGSVASFERQLSVKDTSPVILKMSARSNGGQIIEDAEISIEVEIGLGWESPKNLGYFWDYNFSGTFDISEITQVNKTVHSYPKQGTYLVAVRVWDSDSFVEESIIITVYNVKPEAKFSYRLVQSGEIRFDASLSEDTMSDLTTLEYQWNFDDGRGWSNWSRNPVVLHMFESDGNYSVSLRVRDDNGAVDETSAWVTVDRSPPSIGNIMVGEAIVGKAITVTASVEDNIALRNVTLFYEVNNETFSTPMLKSEGSSNIWVGQIKSLNKTGIIVYWIEAVDVSGNKFTTGKLEVLVTEKAIQPSFWILGLSIAGLVLGGLYVYVRQFSTAVDEVFVIYENGCLIAHDTRRLKPGMDNDVLSSMLVAIQDFVKTAFKDEDTTALKRLDFGEKKILVEKGEKIYLVAVLHGKYDSKIAQKMPKILNEIHRDYGSIFAQWDGDLEKVRGVRDKAHLLFAREWKIPVEFFKSIRKRLSIERALTVECPICGEKISPKNSQCPSCGAELDYADISELEDLAKKIGQGEGTPSIKNESGDQNIKGPNDSNEDGL